jgi:hypothetical protein
MKQSIWQKLIVECQRWGSNENILKTVYLNVGSDLQNIKLEHNIEIKGSRSFTRKYLGSILLTLENSTKKCWTELSKPGKQPKHYVAYCGVNMFQ